MSESMIVQQAVFASSDLGKVKGYQLVAKSLGIDRTCSQQLCLWSPTQMPSDDPADWSINYFPVTEDSVAVTRTVLGGPEYSNRGGTQVVTLILVLSNEQFAVYGYNAMSVAATAMAMGWLRLPLDMSRGQLEPISLPSRPIVDPPDPHAFEDELLTHVMELVQEARRVAILGANDPSDMVTRLIAKLSGEARREFSFTTGLLPAVRRPFQAHFLPAIDNVTRRTLDSQNIVCVNGS